MTKEELIEKYSLSDEQKEKIFEIAVGILTYNKTPVDKPICVMVGGQTGAGKSGLIAYSTKMFPNGNVIVLEDDALRHFHPYDQFLAENYPDEYIAITNQLTNDLTKKLFEKFAEKGYNLVFHQTFKGPRIANEGIPMLREQGYSIVVRGLAVSEFESRMSMVERCLGQLEYKGYCRNVTVSDHDNTYRGMPGTVEYIEQNGRFDVLEIFKRGTEIEYPKLIYAKTNPQRPGAVVNISKHPEVSRETNTFGYADAKDAILKGREEDKADFLAGDESRAPYKERMEEIESNPYLTPVISEQVLDLKALITQDSSQDPIQ